MSGCTVLPSLPHGFDLNTIHSETQSLRREVIRTLARVQVGALEA